MTEQHPFLSEGIPGWLNRVPLEVPKPTLVDIAEGKPIPVAMLKQALQVEIGSMIGVISIIPDLAQRVTEFTENASWQHLPPEPTTVTRTGKDTWEIKVGGDCVVVSKEDIEAKLTEITDEP